MTARMASQTAMGLLSSRGPLTEGFMRDYSAAA